MAIYEEVICCKQCGKTKPHTHFSKQKRWSTTLDSITEHLNSRVCKECTKHNQNVIKRLEKEFPYPTHEVCDGCGTDFTNKPKRSKRYLVLDHNHKTDEFRAYLCEPCNTGTGKLGDTYEEVKRRASFMNRQEELQNKHRRKDYQPNNNTIKVKPKKELNVMNNSTEILPLVKYLIDRGEVGYANQAVESILSKQFGVDVVPSKPTKTKSSTSSKDKLRRERRKELKHQFISSLKPYDSNKNLRDARNVLGLTSPISIVNRSESKVLKYMNSGIFYQNPNGTQNFFIDVDKLDIYKSI